MTQENLEEAFVNMRDAAQNGVFIQHPNFNTSVGSPMDYYHPSTGDKFAGRITVNDGRKIHIKDDQTGDVHKFDFMPKEAYERRFPTKVEESFHVIPNDIKKQLIESVKKADAVEVKNGFQKALFSTLNKKLEAKKKKTAQALFQRPKEGSEKED